MKIEKIPEGIKVSDISNLSLPETLDCGQCFRWKPDENGNWRGVVKGVYGKIRQENDGIIFIGADERNLTKSGLIILILTVIMISLNRISAQMKCFAMPANLLRE